MNLPYSDNLNIGYLSRLFDRNRVFNCYKYFWMLAILNKISVEKTSFTYNELLDEMIVHAWYMVTEFNLKLGPCNTTDNLEEVVRYISTEYKLASTVEEGKLHEFLRTTENVRIDKYKEKLIVLSSISIDRLRYLIFPPFTTPEIHTASPTHTLVLIYCPASPETAHRLTLLHKDCFGHPYY